MLRAEFPRPAQAAVNHDIPTGVNLFSAIFDYGLGNKKKGRQS
jgi:hypothetical protein